MREYLRDVFTDGRLDSGRFVDGFFKEDEVGLLDQLGVLDLSSGPARGRHSPLSDVRRP